MYIVQVDASKENLRQWKKRGKKLTKNRIIKGDPIDCQSHRSPVSLLVASELMCNPFNGLFIALFNFTSGISSVNVLKY